MLKPGDLAPEFKLPSTSAAESEFSLEALLSSGGCFIVFVKKTCPTCRWALPYFNRFPQGAESIPTVVITQDSVGDARTMQEELDVGPQVLVDADPYLVSEAFGIRFVPSGLLLDSEGRVEIAFESFERDAIEQAYVRIVGEAQSAPRLFPVEEGVPGFRPG